MAGNTQGQEASTPRDWETEHPGVYKRGPPTVLPVVSATRCILWSARVCVPEMWWLAVNNIACNKNLTD